jgi:ubiquinone/menaquinone biosynthesis C-methylase UbiE
MTIPSRPTKPLAYDAYQLLAEHYAASIDTKPHNAFYDRPAMIAMWPNLSGKRVLDVGCGPGVYTQHLVQLGATVTAIDASDNMLELARKRNGASAEFRQIDISQPLDMFEPASFDFIHAALCLDYISDWRLLFKEFRRLLAVGGLCQISCGHPAFDAEYYQTQHYFSIEQVKCTWTGFGKEVVMPSYRRSLQEMMMPIIESGLLITKVTEPLPTEEFRRADPVRYASLMHRPAFLCIQARQA